MRTVVETYSLAWEGQDYGVGASIGMVHVDERFASSADVLRAADAACYAAKRSGRNRVVSYAHEAAANAPTAQAPKIAV
jgi:GGDEF domain-containing protein